MRGRQQVTPILLLAVLVSLLAGAGCVSRQARHPGPPGSRDGAIIEQPLVSAIFGDNMVLQRGKPDSIWGWSRPGESIHLRIAGEGVSGVAGPEGRWQLKFAPPATGGPYTMTVTDGRRTVEFRNVMVGDVWICGGQSNMELPLRFTDNAAAVAKQADYPDIRYFTVADHTAYRPTHTLEGTWRVVSPQTAAGLAAVAFYFGRRLERETHVPVGLVVDSVGGSAGESWAGAAALRPLHDYDIPLAMLAEFASTGEPPYGNYIMPWYDRYDIGLKQRWNSPGYGASGWKTVHLPGGFAELGVPVVPAVAWFRKEIILSHPPTGPALISLGEVQRMDSVYVNGILVGASAWVEHPRIYDIPADALKQGRNLIAVRIFKTEPDGGFLGRPADLRLTLADHTVIALAGA